MKQKKRVEIKKFNNFDYNSNNVSVEKFYNFYPTNILKQGCGIKNATFPFSKTDKTEYEIDIAAANLNSVDGIAYFKQYFPNNGKTTHRLLIYGNDKKVYINQMLDDTNQLFWLYDLKFNSAPITLSYKKNDNDAIILASDDEMKIWKTNYSPYTIKDVPIITSMCMNEGVLFCTIKEPAFKIWYATNLDAEQVGNISKNSGYISLEDDLGYARKIVTFDQDVYVFRDYGISKISNIKSEFGVSQVYLSNTRIYADTVNICGNYIMFMTNNGLHSFNGVKVTKFDINLDNLPFVAENAVAASLQNKYYLALKINFDDNKQVVCEQKEYVNNALIIIDTENYGYQIVRGVDIKNLLAVKTDEFEKMLVIFNSGYKNLIGEVVDNSKYYDVNLPKFWSSSNLCDTASTKLFTKLVVESDADVKFTLKYDNKEISVTSYKSGLNQFQFKIICNKINLEISSENENATVKNVYLDYYEY